MRYSVPVVADAGVLGLDLDNTVIDYAEAYRVLSRHFGLSDGHVSREAVRSQLRNGPNDDVEWQRFQALLYSEGLEVAQPAAGVVDLFKTCQHLGVSMVIISHKTPTCPSGFGARDLRTPARAWLRKHGISPGWIPEEGVTFHATAREKVARIAEVQPLWFMDDLEEILAMNQFPVEVKRVLYRAGSPWVEREDGVAIADFAALAQQVAL